MIYVVHGVILTEGHKDKTDKFICDWLHKNNEGGPYPVPKSCIEANNFVEMLFDKEIENSMYINKNGVETLWGDPMNSNVPKMVYKFNDDEEESAIEFAATLEKSYLRMF